MGDFTSHPYHIDHRDWRNISLIFKYDESRPVTVLAIDDEKPFMPDFFQEVSQFMIQLDHFNNFSDEVEQIIASIEEIRKIVDQVKKEHVYFIEGYAHLHSTNNCSSKTSIF